jgi:hypothetical protein
MKGVAIAARFTRRRGVIRGKWAASAGAVDLGFALDLTTKSLVSSACLKKSRYAANTQHSQDNLGWSVQNECEGIGGRNDTNKDYGKERISPNPGKVTRLLSKVAGDSGPRA